MKILLSAYACEPDRGSELGVGWNWAIVLAKAGHQLVVLTRDAEGKPEAIEAALERLSPEVRNNLRFVYHDFEPGGRADSKKQRFKQLRYILWQRQIRPIAKRLLVEESFDLIHHITLGTVRFGSHLSDLGVPFVFGPLGGMEHGPWNLRRHYSARAWGSEISRDISNMLVSYSPLVRRCLRQSALISVRTPETERMVRRYTDAPVITGPEAGVMRRDHAPRKPRPEGRLRLIFAGRLLHWKGLHVAIESYAKACRVRDDIDFTIVGRGPEKVQGLKLAHRLGIADRIEWVDWLPQAELFHAFRTNDALLLPSLHDAGGNVMLESMEAGLPVVCLKLGGPGQMVNDEIGWPVEVEGRDYATVTDEVAAQLITIADNREDLKDKANAAQAHVHMMSWETVVELMYNEIEARLGVS